MLDNHTIWLYKPTHNLNDGKIAVHVHCQCPPPQRIHGITILVLRHSAYMQIIVILGATVKEVCSGQVLMQYSAPKVIVHSFGAQQSGSDNLPPHDGCVLLYWYVTRFPQMRFWLNREDRQNAMSQGHILVIIVKKITVLFSVQFLEFLVPIYYDEICCKKMYKTWKLFHVFCNIAKNICKWKSETADC